MKKILFILSLIFICSINSVYAKNININIDNKNIKVHDVNININGIHNEFKFSPYIFENRTFVPLRDIVEKFDATVIWKNNTKSIKIFNKNNKIIDLQINNKNVKINGMNKVIDEASIPRIVIYKSQKVAKTMVPLRFLSENLGYKVSWNQKNNTVGIYENKEKVKIKYAFDKRKTYNLGTYKKSDIEINKYSKNYKENNENKVIKEDLERTKKLKEIENYKKVGIDITKLAINKNRKITKGIKINHPIKIVIDPGHGGKDSGASAIGGKSEKDFALEVGNKLYNKLKINGYEAYITRSKDKYISLVNRAKKSNDINADIFLSIHFNSGNSLANGIEVLYAPEDLIKIKNVEQEHFANCILKGLKKETNSKIRGLIKRPELFVLKMTKNVSALAELGFVTNNEDMNNINKKEYINKLVNGLYNGILNYIDLYVNKE